jgi:hypothetical protein
VEDHLLCHWETATVRRRPADADPPMPAEQVLPGETCVEAFVLPTRTAGAAQVGELADEVFGEPFAHLRTERFVLGGEPEVHLLTLI